MEDIRFRPGDIVCHFKSETLSEEEKAQNSACIRELKQFTRDNFPLFGCHSWEMNLRMSTFFMHYDSKLAFAVLYMVNQLYRKARQHK